MSLLTIRSNDVRNYFLIYLLSQLNRAFPVKAPFDAFVSIRWYVICRLKSHKIQRKLHGWEVEIQQQP